MADYSQLMKDFPLNDLLSATELDRIRSALIAIFSHMRKIRNTRYPMQRALKLVEAISRDLSNQILKVCHITYSRFVKSESDYQILKVCQIRYSRFDISLTQSLSNQIPRVCQIRYTRFVKSSAQGLLNQINIIWVFRNPRE